MQYLSIKRISRTCARSGSLFLLISLCLVSCSPNSDSNSEPVSPSAPRKDSQSEANPINEPQDSAAATSSNDRKTEPAIPVVNLQQGAQRIAAYAANESNNLHYLIAVSACKNEKCPIQVNLVNQNRIVDTLDFEWSSSSQEVKFGSLGYGYGAGDLLDKTTQYPTWTVGSNEYDTVSNIMRTVKLSPNLNGLLVHQSTGFEHLHRRHSLFVAINGKLKEVWNARETNGPSWSTMLISNSGLPDSQKMIYLNGIKLSLSGVEDQFDTLNITYLSWNRNNNQLDTNREKFGELYAVVAYPFTNTTQARQSLDKNQSCFGHEFDILPASRFNQLKLEGNVVVATVTEDKRKANEMLKTIPQCASKMKLRLIPY